MLLTVNCADRRFRVKVEPSESIAQLKVLVQAALYELSLSECRDEVFALEDSERRGLPSALAAGDVLVDGDVIFAVLRAWTAAKEVGAAPGEAGGEEGGATLRASVAPGADGIARLRALWAALEAATARELLAACVTEEGASRVAGDGEALRLLGACAESGDAPVRLAATRAYRALAEADAVALLRSGAGRAALGLARQLAGDAEEDAAALCAALAGAAEGAALVVQEGLCGPVVAWLRRGGPARPRALRALSAIAASRGGREALLRAGAAGALLALFQVGVLPALPEAPSSGPQEEAEEAVRGAGGRPVAGGAGLGPEGALEALVHLSGSHAKAQGSPEGAAAASGQTPAAGVEELVRTWAALARLEGEPAAVARHAIRPLLRLLEAPEPAATAAAAAIAQVALSEYGKRSAMEAGAGSALAGALLAPRGLAFQQEALRALANLAALEEARLQLRRERLLQALLGSGNALHRGDAQVDAYLSLLRRALQSS
eukprot:tig00021433_g21266.t1